MKILPIGPIAPGIRIDSCRGPLPFLHVCTSKTGPTLRPCEWLVGHLKTAMNCHCARGLPMNCCLACFGELHMATIGKSANTPAFAALVSALVTMSKNCFAFASICFLEPPFSKDPEGESPVYTPNFSMLLSQPIMQDIMLLDPSGNNDWVPDANKLGELPLLETHITPLLLPEVSFAFVAALFPHVLSMMVHKTKPCTDQ
ncbi:hypothetical protein BZA77DRAFT_168328 [Pyronema omphalodes]|nr:hypothetical protein BZA77DRAFT_168328 [Pyronema omphalodes]